MYKIVNDFLGVSKFILEWFITSKMIKKLYTALYADDDLLSLVKILEMSHFVVMKWALLV